ncbi:SDR family NAD(P)-dependent oxidoreductase [Frankia sp. Ag45/Mut15]|uniref:SDR family NAD(P)-dependent oxidoreductase n=1 Tax=Frankia umida TaxID=573489 RepID=A0ABT0K040_9ACTN|nr:SDR family NAD(P)-dependent oxidoreductase [Frankia umida]MCK9877159.1 SDR family NAD(P)-dependent oxidoreductase [Frankia umida]
MTITFITGANKGLGRETTRRLVEAGHTVVLGARDQERGAAAAADLGVRFVPIDITDDTSVATAAADIERHEGTLDVLINNAGMLSPQEDPNSITGADAQRLFDVNLFGAIRTTSAFLPLLRRSPDPVIINVTSGLGSLALTHDPSRVESTVNAPLYCASKAALTMLTTQYAKALPGVRINAVDPGYTATDLNGHTGTQTVTEGTDAIVALATEAPGSPSGRVVDRAGELP